MEVSFELIEQFLDHDSNPVFPDRGSYRRTSCRNRYGLFQKRIQQNAAQMAIKKVKDQTFMDTVNEAKCSIRCRQKWKQSRWSLN